MASVNFGTTMFQSKLSTVMDAGSAEWAAVRITTIVINATHVSRSLIKGSITASREACDRTALFVWSICSTHGSQHSHSGVDT